MNVLVLGRGRMGRAVQQLAAERGHTVLGPLGRHEGEAPREGDGQTRGSMLGWEQVVKLPEVRRLHADVHRVGDAGWRLVLPGAGL